jgi:hypothetical protein
MRGQKIYVRCLYNGHKRNPKILEDEPKYIDASKLTSFKVNAPHVQASILEFIGILRSKEDGYANQGEAPALEIEPLAEPPSQASVPVPETYDGKNPLSSRGPHTSLPGRDFFFLLVTSSPHSRPRRTRTGTDDLSSAG